LKNPRARRSKGSASGLGVDAWGGPVVDPTENVISLTQAESKRQDDLRTAERRWITAKLKSVSAQARLRAQHAKEVHNYVKEIAEKESKRIDAVRAVDVLAAQTESARSLSALATLAAQTTTMAETLRAAVAQTAVTLATSTAQIINPIIERIASLEKSSYEGSGKSSGVGASWQTLVGGVGLVAALLTMGVMIFSQQRPVSTPTPAPTPPYIIERQLPAINGQPLPPK